MEQSSHDTIQLYQSTEHPCSYLEDQQAQNLVIDPNLDKDGRLYSFLVGLGFRRSGTMIYRPGCPNCDQCTPIRISVDQFKPNRSQRRIWKNCQEVITVVDQPASYNPEHYALFIKYLEQRHADGEMTQMSAEEYMQFLGCSWLDTRFIELRLNEQLVGMIISDVLPDGQSAVYTYFDPDHHKLGLGVFAVLWQIESCKRVQKPWLYLGYWIKSCRKMAYKANFKPYQALLDNHWIDHTEANSESP